MRKINSLKSIDLIIQEITKTFPTMINNGSFPTAKQMEQHGLSSISFAIRKYHGGSAAVAEQMNCYLPGIFKTSDGHFVQSANEYEIDEFLYKNKIKHEYNKNLPDSNYKYDFKIEHKNEIFYIEVWGIDKNCTKIYDNYLKNRRKKEKFYKQHNLNLISIEKKCFSLTPPLLYKHLENLFDKFIQINIDAPPLEIFENSPRLYNKELVEQRLREVILKLNRFPSTADLLHIHQGALVTAITKFGGTNYWRKHFGFPTLNYWNEKSIIEELKIIIKKYGTIPCANVLRRQHSGLLHAMVKIGGINYYRKMFNVKILQENKNYYNDNIIIEKLHQSFVDLKKFPTQMELKKYFGNQALLNAINRRGGLLYFEKLHDKKHNKTFSENKKKCRRCQMYHDYTSFKKNGKRLYSLCSNCMNNR